MKTLTVSEAEGRLGQLLVETARDDVIVLTDDGSIFSAHPSSTS